MYLTTSIHKLNCKKVWQEFVLRFKNILNRILYRTQMNSNVKTGNSELNWALEVKINKHYKNENTVTMHILLRSLLYCDRRRQTLTEDKKKNGVNTQGHWLNITGKCQTWVNQLIPVSGVCWFSECWIKVHLLYVFFLNVCITIYPSCEK